MPATQKKSKEAEKPLEKVSSKEAKQKIKEDKKNRNLVYACVIIAAIILLFIATFFLFIGPSSLFGVPFSTFKSNFVSAQRVAIVIYFKNATVLGSEAQCFTTMIQTISHNRNPSTIDFFTITNSSCTYSPNGLGHAINLVNTNSSSCLKVANSEPGIFMNYSQTNRTVVTAYHLYLYSNAQYLAQCPIAVDLS